MTCFIVAVEHRCNKRSSRIRQCTRDENENAGSCLPAFEENLAATYSRASYTGTTIGKTVFDGRVRDGIGSDHSFMATKKDIGWLRVVGSRLFSTMTAAAKWKRAVLGWSKSPAPATTRHHP